MGVGIVLEIVLVEMVGVICSNGIDIDVNGYMIVLYIWVVGDCVNLMFKDECIWLESVGNVID